MRNGFLPVLVAGAAVATVAMLQPLRAIEAAGSRGSSNHRAQFREGEAVVRLKKPKRGMQAQSFGMQVHGLLNELGQNYAVTTVPIVPERALVKVKVENKVPMGQLLSDIEATGDVEYAEPNYLYYASTDGPRAFEEQIKAVIPNDPSFNWTWGLLNVGQADPKGQVGKAGVDIGATKAWALSTGSNDVTLAIIDTGLDYTHEDLAENVYVNPGEIAGNGIDDDENGYIDDVSGWNFVAASNDPMDDNGHGTHVAGTIGAKGDNGIGVAGVNWKVKIMPLKFLSGEGSGSLADAVSAIQYATTMKVKLTSNSWGGGSFSQTMFDAIDEARKAGILFVAAAGNDSQNNDAEPSYPASYELDNVISVAATDNRDEKARFSNFGRRTVHLAAPGVNIFSTIPGKMGGYASYSGTSMACPHVSGAAALVWALNPGMSYSQVKGRLLDTVDKVRGLRAKTITGGRLNVFNALTNVIPVPDWDEPRPDQWKQVAHQLESEHPYADNASLKYKIHHPGAKFIRLHFSKVETEKTFDFVRVKSKTGELAEELTGTKFDYLTDYLMGDTAVIELSSDGGVDGFGFALDRYEVVE